MDEQYFESKAPKIVLAEEKKDHIIEAKKSMLEIKHIQEEISS